MTYDLARILAGNLARTGTLFGLPGAPIPVRNLQVQPETPQERLARTGSLGALPGGVRVDPHAVDLDPPGSILESMQASLHAGFRVDTADLLADSGWRELLGLPDPKPPRGRVTLQLQVDASKFTEALQAIRGALDAAGLLAARAGVAALDAANEAAARERLLQIDFGTVQLDHFAPPVVSTAEMQAVVRDFVRAKVIRPLLDDLPQLPNPAPRGAPWSARGQRNELARLKAQQAGAKGRGRR